MEFQVVGKKENPVIIMFNGSFCTGKGLLPIAEQLADAFYVILPTYNGHYENSGVFTSRIDQAQKAFEYLKTEGIKSLALIHGVSMGAEVAMELVKILHEDGSIKIGHCFFDGGPFFHFPAFFRRIMQKKFLTLVKPGKLRTEAQVNELLESKMIKWVVGEDTQPYRHMITDMNCSRYMTKQSVKNESDACYTFDMYEFPESLQKKFLFIWSDDEPARKSKKNLIKKCPMATYQGKGNLGHCGLLVKEPVAYVNMMREMAGRINE